MANDRALLGIQKDDAEAAPAFLLWPDNLDPLRAFLVCSTQWRWVPVTGPTGGTVVRTGLDYPGARAALQMAGIKVTPELFADIQTLEAAALAEWARQREG